MKTKALTIAIALLSTPALAGSGNAVLHSSSKANGSQYPNCGTWYTAVPNTPGKRSDDPNVPGSLQGVGSDDGIKYGADLTTSGGSDNFAIARTSDATQTPIVFQLSPCPVIQPGTCPSDVVPVCNVGWK